MRKGFIFKLQAFQDEKLEIASGLTFIFIFSHCDMSRLHAQLLILQPEMDDSSSQFGSVLPSPRTKTAPFAGLHCDGDVPYYFLVNATPLFFLESKILWSFQPFFV